MPKLTKATQKLRAAKLVKVLQKNGGNRAKAARELGVTRQAVQDKINQPEVQKALQNVIDDCLNEAGVTTQKVYSQLAAQLDAKTESWEKDKKTGKAKLRPNWNAQDSARKDALELLGHKGKKDDGALGNELAESLKNSDLAKLKNLLCLLK